MKKRNLEIDLLRGIAIIMMIIFHFLFDLKYFFDVNINTTTGFLDIFRILTVTLFLFLVGISLTLSNKNAKQNTIRGFKILFLGLVISLVTYFIFSESLVLFGILHLIGLSVIVLYLFRNFLYLNLILGIFSFLLGIYFKNIDFESNIFLIFGIITNYYSVDYTPIFPWIGIIYIGLFIGKLFNNYFIKRKIFLKENKFTSLLEFFGRNSLIIYFLHQIVLFSGFWLLIKLIN